MARFKAKAILTIGDDGKAVYKVKRKWWFFWMYIGGYEFKTIEDAKAWIRFQRWDDLSSTD